MNCLQELKKIKTSAAECHFFYFSPFAVQSCFVHSSDEIIIPRYHIWKCMSKWMSLLPSMLFQGWVVDKYFTADRSEIHVGPLFSQILTVLQPSFKFIYTAFLTLPHYSPIKQSFQTLIVVIFPKCSFLSLHRWTSSGRCWHFGDSAAFTRSAKTSQLSDFKIIGGSSNCDAFFQLMKADMSKSLANSLFTHTADAQQH